jgi:LPXTG-site transpeptidase (sortase) family protein
LVVEQEPGPADVSRDAAGSRISDPDGQEAFLDAVRSLVHGEKISAQRADSDDWAPAAQPATPHVAPESPAPESAASEIPAPEIPAPEDAPEAAAPDPTDDDRDDWLPGRWVSEPLPPRRPGRRRRASAAPEKSAKSTKSSRKGRRGRTVDATAQEGAPGAEVVVKGTQRAPELDGSSTPVPEPSTASQTQKRRRRRPRAPEATHAPVESVAKPERDTVTPTEAEARPELEPAPEPPMSSGGRRRERRRQAALAREAAKTQAEAEREAADEQAGAERDAAKLQTRVERAAAKLAKARAKAEREAADEQARAEHVAAEEQAKVEAAAAKAQAKFEAAKAEAEAKVARTAEKALAPVQRVVTKANTKVERAAAKAQTKVERAASIAHDGGEPDAQDVAGMPRQLRRIARIGLVAVVVAGCAVLPWAAPSVPKLFADLVPGHSSEAAPPVEDPPVATAHGFTGPVGVAEEGGPFDGQRLQAAGRPLEVSVPRLHVDSKVIPISGQSGSLLPPSDPQQLGWWKEGKPVGAESGTAVVTGHTVHTGGGALDHLDKMVTGDTVRVRTDAGWIKYIVQRTRIYSTKQLSRDADKIFRLDGIGRLVLITCDDWNGEIYLSNAVVIATPVLDAPFAS